MSCGVTGPTAGNSENQKKTSDLQVKKHQLEIFGHTSAPLIHVARRSNSLYIIAWLQCRPNKKTVKHT